MKAIIRPAQLSGDVTPPASKSMMQRVCAGALLHNGRTIIINPGRSDDDKAALQIIREMGVDIAAKEKGLIETISKGIVNPPDTIHCGESGLSARLFTPIAALADKQVTITGTGSLLLRPMNILHDILPQLGVNLPGFNSYLPITVRGPLNARSIAIDGSFSSQYLTGLLFALTAAAKVPITIEVAELNSKPYVDLTLDVLGQFGKKVQHEDYRVFSIDPSTFAPPEVVTVTIEGDWSSAAFLLAAGAINGNVSVHGLRLSSTQADKAIVEVLKQAGADIQVCENNVTVTSERTLQAFKTDSIDCPDLFPVLSILASCAEGQSEIAGIKRLTHKESNRATSICAMLQQFGVAFRIEGDSLLITGRQVLKAGRIDSYRDHRIAMAAAIGGLYANGEVTITDADAVSKSYPEFFKHLASLGAQLNLIS
jgi:3-phosphoshikimate 1-carboxyvinyltransferase